MSSLSVRDHNARSDRPATYARRAKNFSRRGAAVGTVLRVATYAESALETESAVHTAEGSPETYAGIRRRRDVNAVALGDDFDLRFYRVGGAGALGAPCRERFVRGSAIDFRSCGWNFDRRQRR